MRIMRSNRVQWRRRVISRTSRDQFGLIMVFILIPVGHGKHYKDICLLLICISAFTCESWYIFYDQTLVSGVSDMQSDFPLNLTCPLDSCTHSVSTTMQLVLISALALVIFSLHVNALNIIQKTRLVMETPPCALFCGGKISKELHVSYLNGREHCENADWQSKYKTCLRKFCTSRQRRRVIELCA